MIKNPGRKVKTLAVILLLFYIVIGALGGMFFGAVLASGGAAAAGIDVDLQQSGRTLAVLCPILGALIGLLIGWVNTIVLYAFGALVEETESIRTQLMGLGLDVAAIRNGAGISFGGAPGAAGRE